MCFVVCFFIFFPYFWRGGVGVQMHYFPPLQVHAGVTRWVKAGRLGLQSKCVITGVNQVTGSGALYLGQNFSPHRWRGCLSSAVLKNKHATTACMKEGGNHLQWFWQVMAELAVSHVTWLCDSLHWSPLTCADYSRKDGGAYVQHCMRLY